MDSFANCAVVIVRDAAAVVWLVHRHLLNHVANNDVDCVAVVSAAAMGNKTVDGDDQDEVGQAVEDHTEMTEDNDDVRNMMVEGEGEEGVSKKKEKNGHCHMEEEGQDE